MAKGNESDLSKALRLSLGQQCSELLTTNRKKASAFLSECGLRLIPIPGDGACLVRFLFFFFLLLLFLPLLLLLCLSGLCLSGADDKVVSNSVVAYLSHHGPALGSEETGGRVDEQTQKRT